MYVLFLTRPMMTITMKIGFRTTHPLSQHTGMRMWETGEHFGTLPGDASYQLTTTGEAPDIATAVEGIGDIITAIVQEDRPDETVHIFRVSAKEVN
jgi:hypothetical protein